MKKILIIDENINDYKNFINELKSEYEVEDVGYIQTARYKLDKFHYDLIILDIMMPTLGLFNLKKASDGLRTGFVYYDEELKKKNIPVLFWSWNSDFEKEIEDIKKENKEWSKTDFLLKESDYNHLLIGVNIFFEKLNKQRL